MDKMIEELKKLQWMEMVLDGSFDRDNSPYNLLNRNTRKFRNKKLNITLNMK